MKKITLLALAALAFVASCTKENTSFEEGDLSESGVTQFTAVIDETVKTSLSAGAVSWTAGDEISVFDENGTNFKFTASASGATATFTKTSSGELQGTTFYAVYPYNADASIEGGVITTSTASSYTVEDEGTFTSCKSALMIAKTTTGELRFKNMSSLFKFEIPSGVSIAKLYFYASGADLSGQVSVSVASDGTPALTSTPATYNGITLHAASGSTLAAGTYYLPVIPNTYNNLRVRITYNSEDGPGSEAFTVSSFTAARNKVTNIGTIYDGRSWYKFITFENGAVPSFFEPASAAQLSIVDNPVVGEANKSAKCLKVRMESSGSGYIGINLSSVNQNIRKNITGVVLHYKPTGLKYCPRVKFNSVTKGPLKVGSSTSGDGEYTGSTYQSLIQKDYWNKLTFKASQFGVSSFENITYLTIYPMLYSSGSNNSDTPAEVLIDNIGFCFD